MQVSREFAVKIPAAIGLALIFHFGLTGSHDAPPSAVRVERNKEPLVLLPAPEVPNLMVYIQRQEG